AVEDIVLLVAQELLSAADLLPSLIHDRRLLRHGQPGDLVLVRAGGHLKGPPARKRPRKRQFVGVFELAANRQPMRQSGRSDLEWRQLLGKVGRGRLPFHVWIGCQDDLGYGLPAQPAQQLASLQLGWPDAVDW